MDEKLKKLKEALMTISTRGNDTLTMANCIHYIDQLCLEKETKAHAEPAVETYGK